jgi:hypothetical protein
MGLRTLGPEGPSARPIDDTRSGPHADEGVADEAADQVEEVVERHPWIETVARLGWLSKGVVYGLMGVLAFAIARLEPGSEDASPEGALSLVLERPGGRYLLGAVGVGLALYSAWRLLSVVLERRDGLEGWLHRLGYLFSGVFYGLLTVTAIRSALAGHDPERSTTVERVSSSLLGSSVGRWLVLIGGLIVIGVAGYFIREAVGRRFRDELDLGDAGKGERRLIDIVGVTGHLGRGLVTFLVGLFVTVAAVRVDPDEARGFDRALRSVAETSWGTYVVGAAAIGLITYGLFCLVSLRHRDLVDGASGRSGR